MVKRGSLSPEVKEELYRSVIPIASEFRKKFLDENVPIADTFQTLEQLGFFIVRFPTHNNLSGFHLKKGGYDCIFINSAHQLGRQYFSGWHECYHAYTGEGGGISLEEDMQLDEIEYKAECFAGCILMPETMVREYIQSKRWNNLRFVKYEELIQMQNYFRVSLNALITRILQIFPYYKDALSNRYSLSQPNRIDEMLKKIRSVNGDEALILPANDFSVSQRLYETLHQNLSNDRISAEKVHSILEMLDHLREKYET